MSGTIAKKDLVIELTLAGTEVALADISEDELVQVEQIDDTEIGYGLKGAAAPREIARAKSRETFAWRKPDTSLNSTQTGHSTGVAQNSDTLLGFARTLWLLPQDTAARDPL